MRERKKEKNVHYTYKENVKGQGLTAYITAIQRSD